MTFPTALAAPVEAGMMFWAAVLPSRQAYTVSKQNEHGQSINVLKRITFCVILY